MLFILENRPQRIDAIELSPSGCSRLMQNPLGAAAAQWVLHQPARETRMPKHLTAAQLAQFRSEGYVFPLRAVSPAQAAEYRARIEAYETQVGFDANRTLKIKGNLAFPWLMELGRNP